MLIRSVSSFVNHFLKNHFNSFSFKRELAQLDIRSCFRRKRCLEKRPKALKEGGHKSDFVVHLQCVIPKNEFIINFA